VNNLASRHPAKPAETKALFGREAKANNVYPVINWSDLSIGITDFQRKTGPLPPCPSSDHSRGAHEKSHRSRRWHNGLLFALPFTASLAATEHQGDCGEQT
jgi:hypothetical protein